MIDLIKKFPLLFVAIGVLLVFFILSGILLLSGGRSEQAIVLAPTPTPVQIETSNKPLTTREQDFPQATPQPFKNPNATETGTLVVTANIDGVTVLVDATEHAEGDDPIAKDEEWPQNTPPFTVPNITVGKHTLFAFKVPDYNTETYEYEIKPGEITRVHIIMKLLEVSD